MQRFIDVVKKIIPGKKQKPINSDSSDSSDSSTNSDKKSNDIISQPSQINITKIFSNKDLKTSALILFNSYIYESKEPVKEVKINHELDSENLFIQVWSKNNDFWSNDFVSVQIIDKNNVLIELYEPKIIKVLFEKSKYDKIFQVINDINDQDEQINFFKDLKNIRDNIIKRIRGLNEFKK